MGHAMSVEGSDMVLLQRRQRLEQLGRDGKPSVGIRSQVAFDDTETQFAGVQFRRIRWQEYDRYLQEISERRR